MLNDTVGNVVSGLNQELVNDMKLANTDGKLTKEEIEDIKEKAIKRVFNILGENGTLILKSAYGDLSQLVDSKIEKVVQDAKKWGNPKCTE